MPHPETVFGFEGDLRLPGSPLPLLGACNAWLWRCDSRWHWGAALKPRRSSWCRREGRRWTWSPFFRSHWRSTAPRAKRARSRAAT
eukprot:2953236-Pyramimonas_sp.AAC.1